MPFFHFQVQLVESRHCAALLRVKDGKGAI